MPERNKGGSYRSGDFYGAPDQPAANSRRNNIGSVQPNGQNVFEETQLYRAGGQPGRPDDPQYRSEQPPRYPQQYQGQQYQYQQPPQNNYYGGQPPYGQPPYPQYNPPRRRPVNTEPDDDDDDDSSSKGTMILVLITLLIVLAIAVGAIIFLLKKENEGAASSSSQPETTKAAYEEVTETETETEAETETETETEEVTTESPFAEVPNITGRYIDVARIQLTEAGITFTEEYEFSDKVDKDYVISQNVAGGTKVAKDTEVKIVISKGQKDADMAEVPDVIGKNYRKAASELEKLGLTVIVDETRDDPGYAKDEVIAQSIAAGSKVKKGSSIHLTVSNGNGKTSSTQTEPTTELIAES